jgi:hypothetical protein
MPSPPDFTAPQSNDSYQHQQKIESPPSQQNSHPSSSSSASTHSGGTSHQHHNGHHDLGLKLTRVKSVEVCRVCGDGPARMHYGVPTCFGCKGFFRRTLKRTKEYSCRYNGNCVVDRYERNSCRYCRFKRCLEVGMDPKAVRPDRDAAGRSHPIRHRRSRNSLGEIALEDEDDNTDDWIRKLPVDMRTLLMQIMNMDLLVAHGDTTEDAKKIYPLPFSSIRQILEEPHLLDGKRTEIRYETFRQIQGDELAAIAHRRLIACIDTVDHLFSLMDLHNPQDKIAIIKSSYAPLSIFSFSAATAKVTKQRDILCLCNYGFVPRDIQNTIGDLFHLGNRVVDRAIDELVEPFRSFNFKDQEMALMNAIVVLNPHIKTLSAEAAEQIADLRDRVQETLYNVVRESHPKEVASSRFGNLLLFLPTIMMLGNIIYENLQFASTFGKQQVDPLLAELLDNLEPVHDVNGLNVEEVLLMADNSDQFIRSQSSSSICSLNSHCSGSSFEQGYSSSASGSCNRIPSTANLHVSESDPDYNVTLTQQRYADIRQNIGSQPMDVDSCCGNSIMSSEGTTPDFYQQQKPRFFIESGNPIQQQQQHLQQLQQQQPQSHQQQQQHQSTVINGGHHIFTVETNNDPIYSTPSSKSAHCLLNNRFPQQQQQQQQQQNSSNNGYSNDIYYSQQQSQQNGDPSGSYGNGINGQPLPQMIYDDSSTTLSKSQSYPCYGYLLDDSDTGPPTLQAQQQAFLNQSSSRY